VLEEDLAGVTTYSVGQVRVAGLVASYCGTQRLTPDNTGEAVYGGSELLVARRGFEELARESRAALTVRPPLPEVARQRHAASRRCGPHRGSG
jgi:hypothetical protein